MLKEIWILITVTAVLNSIYTAQEWFSDLKSTRTKKKSIKIWKFEIRLHSMVVKKLNWGIKIVFEYYDIMFGGYLGSYNQFHNILRLFNVLPNFPFTTSETVADYYL